MSERQTYHLDDLLEEPLPLGSFFEPLMDGSKPSRPIVTKSGRHVCNTGRTIVANGCFDLLHPGHLSLLGWLDTIAYQRRLRPIVALNSDESVRLLKGPDRPVNHQLHRATLINHLKWPLTVIIFDEETPSRLLELLRPEAVLKGSEYDPASVVRPAGTEVITVPMVGDWSTTRILGDSR